MHKMYTCIRCLEAFAVDSSLDDEAVVICPNPECGFHVTAGDLRFIQAALGAPAEECPTCHGAGRILINVNGSRSCNQTTPLSQQEYAPTLS